MEKILSDFGVQPILLAAQIVNFLVLLFILQKLLYKPILKVLEERKRKIEEGLLNAEKIKKELEETKAKSQQVIDKAIEESKKIVIEANIAASQIRTDAKVQSKADAEAIMEQGMQMIAGEKEKMKSEVKSEVAVMIQMSLEKVLGKELDVKVHKKLVDDAVKNI